MSSYLFIDGEYFRQAYETGMLKFFGVVPPVDYPALSGTFGAPHRIFYYSAVDRLAQKNETEAQREQRVKHQDAFHAYLNSLPWWHVREGFLSRGRRAARRSQKAVDVQLAVDALEHAVAHNMSRAIFVFGDLDFEPLLFSLSRFGITTTVYYEPGTASDELLEAADERRPMTIGLLHDAATPNFKVSHPPPIFRESFQPPDWKVLNVGTWNGREVKVFDWPDTGLRLYVEAGPDAIREPSITIEYQLKDANRIEMAFLMAYGGAIEWN